MPEQQITASNVSTNLSPSLSQNLSQIGLAYDLAKRAKKSARLHVWICPDVRSYRILAEELSFFLQDKPELLWRFLLGKCCPMIG